MNPSSEKELQAYFQKVTDQANGIAKRAAIALFCIGVLLAIFHQTWLVALISGAALLSIFFLPLALGAYNKYLNSLVLAGFTIQFHYQLGGLPASHFFFFVVLTILLFYEDWRTLIPVSVVHVLFVSVLYFLPEMSWIKPFLVQSGTISLPDFLLHVLIVALYTGLCSMWSVLQHRQTKESALQANLMKEQLKLIDINQRFAESISHGNLQAEYPSSNPDNLGESLLAMRKSLLTANEREERERFTTAGLANIGDILRLHVNELQVLCDEVLSQLVKYMNANQGSIFTLEEEGTTNEHLQLISARAWDRKKYLEKRIEAGEGLVGQAAIEKSTIYMTDVPENYVSITSGLGQANPRAVIIVPLKNEERVVGVLEMASFKKFEPHEIQFLEKMGESIASTILNSRNNHRNKELLEQARLMTEQMRAQEEEMRQNMEEMQATQEEMERARKMREQQVEEVAAKQNNLRALVNASSDSIIAMDKNYKIIVMNETLRKRYKGTQYEALDVGADALQTLGAVRDEWKGYYDRALKGERLQFTLKSTVQGEDSFREYFINPLLQSDGQIFGVSVVSRDVTDYKKALDKIAMLEAEMTVRKIRI
jgi:PAS domain-containing protein